MIMQVIIILLHYPGRNCVQDRTARRKSGQDAMTKAALISWQMVFSTAEYLPDNGIAAVDRQGDRDIVLHVVEGAESSKQSRGVHLGLMRRVELKGPLGLPLDFLTNVHCVTFVLLIVSGLLFSFSFVLSEVHIELVVREPLLHLWHGNF